MPRPHADTVQVTFRIPSHWVQEADALASAMSRHGMQATRTDAFREAMARGFRAIEEEARSQTRFRVSAWDGIMTTCLFWFGPDAKAAVAEAKRLAKENVGGKWTVFRVFEGDEEEPFHTEMVPEQPPRRGSK